MGNAPETRKGGEGCYSRSTLIREGVGRNRQEKWEKRGPIYPEFAKTGCWQYGLGFL